MVQEFEKWLIVKSFPSVVHKLQELIVSIQDGLGLCLLKYGMDNWVSGLGPYTIHLPQPSHRPYQQWIWQGIPYAVSFLTATVSLHKSILLKF